MNKYILIVVVAVVLMGGVWLYLSGSTAPKGVSLSDIPEVVARVNGKDISGSDLANFEIQLASGQGIDVASLDGESRKQLQTQALDALVSNMLLFQAATALTITATEADVDAQMTTIKSQFQDDTEFEALLLAQGITEADVREQIAIDIVIQAYLVSTLDFDAITVTEAEIIAMYEQEASLVEDVPSLEEVTDQVEVFLVQQKQQELLSAHIADLYADAEVEILI